MIYLYTFANDIWYTHTFAFAGWQYAIVGKKLQTKKTKQTQV